MAKSNCHLLESDVRQDFVSKDTPPLPVTLREGERGREGEREGERGR
jgi:hypothetical protein